MAQTDARNALLCSYVNALIVLFTWEERGAVSPSSLNPPLDK